jgi:cysteine desulfurase
MMYLDYNATTPLDERVLAAMLPYLKSLHGNASSLYRLGRVARTAIDTAREQVAALAGCTAEQVVFTSGGTEANNMALASLLPGTALAVSAIEHPSVMEPALRLKVHGGTVLVIGVDSQGLIDQQSVDNILRSPIGLASVMLANNETGVIQDIEALGERFQSAGVVFHTDAVQALGKIPIAFNAWPVQLMSLSSHKIYGPKGCGALIFAKDTPLKPLLVGGGQEFDLRSGTENVAAVVGFGKAAEVAKTELSHRYERYLSLRTQLEQGLLDIPKLTIFSQNAPRLPNTVQFGIEGCDGEMLVMQLDRKNIAVSTTSACAGGGTISTVLTAMGVAPALARSAVRVSLGDLTTPQQISEFINSLKVLIDLQ